MFSVVHVLCELPVNSGQLRRTAPALTASGLQRCCAHMEDALPLSADPTAFQATYHLVRAGVLQPTCGPVTPFARRVQAQLRRKMLAPEFSCLAGRAVVNTSCYALGCYGVLGSGQADASLARDLIRFCADQDAMGSNFTSMIAVFRGAATANEQVFEGQVWALLRALHARDPQPYSREVVADPRDPKFGFSFNGRGFFVIGLHPHSSRMARRLAYPALVFNAHRQFQALRDVGRFGVLQRAVRRRELELQGTLNPNLADYGEVSEARQYSGRAVEPGWVAPFPQATSALQETSADMEQPASGCPFAHAHPGSDWAGSDWAGADKEPS